MNRATLSLIFASSILLPISAASATITVYGGNLTGTQEVPPNASPGTGNTLITVDDVLATMRVQVTFADLLGTTTASHIHCCGPAGMNVGVATELPLFTGFPVGVHGGTYDHTFDMTLAASYNPAFVTAQGGIPNAFAALINGMTNSTAYLNVHTNQFPGGEIRAQLRPIVPEPSTWAMMLLGFGAIGLAIRRRPRLAPDMA